MRSVSLRSSLASVAGFNSRLALGDTRALAGAAAQVIELGTTHDAAANHGDAVDVRRIDREHALHAFAERNLANGEVRADALVRTGDDDAFVGLDAGALAFDDAHADADGVARAEFGNILGSLGDFLGFDLLDQVHWSKSFFSRRAP